MLYFLIILVVMAVGIAIVLLRHRKPSSMNHSINEFEKGRRALDPTERQRGA